MKIFHNFHFLKKHNTKKPKKVKPTKIEVGTPLFGYMTYCLTGVSDLPLNQDTINSLGFDGHKPKELSSKGPIYIMPVCPMSKKRVMFMYLELSYKNGLDENRNYWTVLFSIGTPVHNSNKYDLGSTLYTGDALNKISHYSSERADDLLRYFSTLTQTKTGKWKLSRPVKV